MAVTPTTPVDPALVGRRRIAAASLTLLAVISATCALAVTTATRSRTRIDLTSTQRYSLAPRTRRILQRLQGQFEIVVVADSTTVSPQSAQRVDDLLQEMALRSNALRITRIDPADAADAVKLRDLLDRLALRDKEAIAGQQVVAKQAVSDAHALASTLTSLAAALTRAGEALAPSEQRAAELQQLAQLLQLQAKRAQASADQAGQALDRTMAGSSLPALDETRSLLLDPLQGWADQLSEFSQALQRMRSDAEEGSPLLDALTGAVKLTQKAEQQAAAVEHAASRLGEVDALRVARLLARQNAVVVIGPHGSTAVSFPALFPRADDVEAVGASASELRFAGEELIASALARLSARALPLVVFVHAAPAKQLDEAGRPQTAAARQTFGALIDRLLLRDIAVREWPVTLEPTRPSFAQEQDDVERRVVWVVIPTAADSVQTAQAMGQLADAVQGLVRDGEPVLLSVNLSPLPGVGEPDPMVAFLEPLGVRVDSGKAILWRERTASGVVVHPEEVFRRAETASPIGQAINGLATLLAWMTPLHFEPPAASDEIADVRFTPIFTLPHDADRWAEAQWRTFRALGASRRASQVQPEPNPSVDDVRGPWTVAGQLEWRLANKEEPARLVVVGSHGWFFDPFTQLATTVDGQRVLAYPGNSELFEACVHWLAGLDELVAPASLSRDAPRIEPVSPAALAAYRWGLALGLPAAIVLLGVTIRVARR